MVIFIMDNFTKKTLDKIKTPHGSERLAKKRRISKVILIIDIILVVIIFMVFNRDSNDTEYYSTSVTYNNIVYRFSASKEMDTDNYLFSLSLRSNSNVDITERFKRSIAEIKLYGNDKFLFKTVLGENVQSIRLQPGELKTFITEIGNSKFTSFAEANPDTISPQKDTLLMFEDKHILLNAIITINTKEKIITDLKFKYEVDK